MGLAWLTLDVSLWVDSRCVTTFFGGADASAKARLFSLVHLSHHIAGEGVQLCPLREDFLRGVIFQYKSSRGKKGRLEPPFLINVRSFSRSRHALEKRFSQLNSTGTFHRFSLTNILLMGNRFGRFILHRELVKEVTNTRVRCVDGNSKMHMYQARLRKARK